MKRDRWQRRAYALRRMSSAVDRVIRGEHPEQARLWANAWAVMAGVKPAGKA